MNYQELGKHLAAYCQKYKIPLQYAFNILEDQKVVPIIRGKATEYQVLLLLKDLLNPNEWSVQKLNLNAQSNHCDEDITVTHLRSGVRILSLIHI